MGDLTSVEICAGPAVRRLAWEKAGFAHEATVELDAYACDTLRRNRGDVWKIIEGDVCAVDGRAYRNVDLFSGGVPCPPFSIAGKQLGSDDDRDLFPQALRLVEEIEPRAVLLENVRGLAASRFDGYRAQILERLADLGFQSWWRLVHASEHGVPQLRPRFVLVAMRPPWASWFRWPEPQAAPPPGVGEALGDLMASRGWPGAVAWARRPPGSRPPSWAAARSTVARTWARPAPGRPGPRWAWTGSASPTRYLGRTSLWASRRS